MTKKRGIEGILSTIQSLQEYLLKTVEKGPIPKGARNFAKKQVTMLRKELANQLSEELSGFIKNLNLAEIIKEVLSDVEIEIKVSLSFNRKKGKR